MPHFCVNQMYKSQEHFIMTKNKEYIDNKCDLIHNF